MLEGCFLTPQALTGRTTVSKAVYLSTKGLHGIAVNRGDTTVLARPHTQYRLCLHFLSVQGLQL